MLWHDVLWYNYGGAGFGAAIAQRAFAAHGGKQSHAGVHPHGKHACGFDAVWPGVRPLRPSGAVSEQLLLGAGGHCADSHCHYDADAVVGVCADWRGRRSAQRADQHHRFRPLCRRAGARRTAESAGCILWAGCHVNHAAGGLAGRPRQLHLHLAGHIGGACHWHGIVLRREVSGSQTHTKFSAERGGETAAQPHIGDVEPGVAVPEQHRERDQQPCHHLFLAHPRRRAAAHGDDGGADNGTVRAHMAVEKDVARPHTLHLFCNHAVRLCHDAVCSQSGRGNGSHGARRIWLVGHLSRGAGPAGRTLQQAVGHGIRHRYINSACRQLGD